MRSKPANVYLLILLVFSILQLSAISSPSARAQANTTTPTFVPTRTPASTPPSSDDYGQIIQDGLQGVAGVEWAKFEDNSAQENGKRKLVIRYDTTASKPTDLVNEWMSILNPVAETIRVQQLVIDEVNLLSQHTDGTL